MKITPELSDLLGLLCAEGCHVVAFSSYWGKDRGKKRYFKNDKSERVEFYNKDIKLVKHYHKLLAKEFDYHPNILNDSKINICKMNIIRTIIKQTPLGHLKWKVPNSVKRSNKKIKLAFLRGYFDGDGTASNTIRFFSTNKQGLLQVSSLLDDFKFKHTMQGPILKEKRKPSYIIQLSRKEKERFLKILQPISKIPDSFCEGYH